MAIKRKSKEELEKQKNDFLRHLQYEWIYSKEIAELICVWNERLLDLDELVDYLEKKWCDENIISTIKDKYIKFLRQNYLYWKNEEYTQKTQTEIRENDYKMESIKKKILDYWKKEWNILLNPDEFIKWKFKDYENSEILWSKNIKDEINDNEKNLENNEAELVEKWKKMEDLKKEIDDYKAIKSKYKSKFSTFLHKKEITDIENKIKEKQHELDMIESEITELEKQKNNLERKRDELKKIEKNVQTCNRCLFDKTLADRFANSSFDWNTFYTNADWDDINKRILGIKDYIWTLLPYLNKDFFNTLYTNLSKQLKDQFEKNDFFKKRISALKVNIKNYINLFFTWNERDWSRIPTVFTKKHFDKDISKIIEELDPEWKEFWDIETDIVTNQVDYWFMNDVFIHQTSFRVIDEILDEWWLVSTNEIRIRKEYNDDLRRSQTNNTHQHKDVYFSRWFADNRYWHPEDLKEAIFFVNTMSNFARRWYWVPLFKNMQKNSLDGSLYLQDTLWYPILSPDVVENGKNYSKVLLEDLFIFIPECKKNELDSILREKIGDYPNNKHYKIVYIPEDLYQNTNLNRGNTYEIYEFMKHYIDEHAKENTKIVPKKIIKSKDAWIKSINEDNRFAFCETIQWDPIKWTEINGEILDDEILWHFIKKILGKMPKEGEVIELLNMINDELKNTWINELPLDFPIWLFKYWLLSRSGGIDIDLLLKLWYSRKETTILKLLVDNNDVDKICNLWWIKIEDMEKLQGIFSKLRQKIS